jgi:hypothetical protein
MLAKSIFLEPNAKLLHGALVKTGYDIMPNEQKTIKP